MYRIVFESTGLTEQFDRMLAKLQSDFNVVTIGVQADSNLCIEWVKSRDAEAHISISDDHVALINEQVLEKDIRTRYVIKNNTLKYRDVQYQIAGILANEMM